MAFVVEVYCPRHGLERFRVKIIKRFNVKANEIRLCFRKKPKLGLSAIIVGRNVKYSEIQDYLIHYFEDVGLMDKIVNIKIQK